MPFYGITCTYSALVKEDLLIYVNDDEAEDFEKEFNESMLEEQQIMAEDRCLDRKVIEVLEVINVTSVDKKKVEWFSV